ncbi:hypothetical protein VRRI112168_15285 [Vreelandella rituensis]|uniref:Uncharacterized protein n=1 Tax=Vreelandella rituensis TaxID=2282306 RepID=A0A368TN95_9GAMM|nr:hypothetical protein [Halomonas rituensis]RCV85776.1 hypothetical protein DU506_20405 [Halomonas rituensis]
MAGLNDATAGLQAVHQNAAILIDACLTHGGRISEEELEPNTLATLRRHRLVFDVDEDYGYVQVSRVVADLLHHLTQSYKRQLLAGAGHDIVNDLEHITESYRMAEQTGSADLLLRETEAREAVASLIDMLRQTILRFTTYIHSDFSMVSDLDQRIHENKRAIEDAKALNQFFDSLMPSYLKKLAGRSPTLQTLLMKLLRRNLDRLRADLLDATHSLRENLARLERDRTVQHYSHLIDDFYKHYLRNPGYQPDPSMLDRVQTLPQCFIPGEGMKLQASSDIENPAQHEELRGLLAQALERLAPDERVAQEDANETIVTVVEQRNAVMQEEEDPFATAINQFFEAIPALILQASAVSAMDAHQTLSVEEPGDVWLLAVWTRYLTLLADRQSDCDYIAQHVEQVLETFSGNREVRDIHFRSAVQ